MRVLMVSKALVVGAYQRKAEEIARCGVELTVLVPPSWRDSRGHQPAEAKHVEGYELIVVPVRFNGRFHLHHYPTLARELARFRPHVLHMDEEPYNMATYRALSAANAQCIPATFFTWQNLLHSYPPPFGWMEQANYRRVSVAIAGNRDAAAVLRAKGYGGEVEVIPQFGVDPNIFSPQKSDFWQKSDFYDADPIPPFIIGYAGGLLPEKGLNTLVHACARLEPGWRLFLAGEGSEQQTLRQLAESLGVATSVDFIGRLPSHEMASFYHRLDTFVLPSRTTSRWQEQFGRVLVEAMACGVPVIGSDSGEIPNVIGDAGLIFDEGDIDDLARLLRQLRHDPAERQQMAGAGRARVLANFTMGSVAERTVKVYERLCTLASTHNS